MSPAPSTTLVEAEAPSSSAPEQFEGDEEAGRLFAFFASRWTVQLGPRRPKCDIAWAAHRISRVEHIEEHVRVRGFHDHAPLPEANLHLVLVGARVAERRVRPELEGFLRRFEELLCRQSFQRIGPRIEGAFRSVNGFEPPSHMGEMFTALTAYACALRCHPDYGNAKAFHHPEVFRSFAQLCGAGNILFHLNGMTVHNLSLAE